VAEEIITPDNVTKELIKSILEAAYMSVTIDKDGDLMVTEQIKCFVFPSKEKRVITLLTGFGFKSSASEADKLLLVNKINTEYLMVSCFYVGSGLRFQHDICLDGGVNAKNIVMTLKRFCSIPQAAVAQSNLIE